MDMKVKRGFIKVTVDIREKNMTIFRNQKINKTMQLNRRPFCYDIC